MSIIYFEFFSLNWDFIKEKDKLKSQYPHIPRDIIRASLKPPMKGKKSTRLISKAKIAITKKIQTNILN